jgi:hypothetical protein
MRKRQGGDLYKAKSRQKSTDLPRSPGRNTQISKESKKRKEQSKTYKQVKDEIRAELIAAGKYDCFFCGKPMKSEKGFHHLKGRDGQNFIDKRYIVPGHQQCHVWDYHHSTVEQLLSFSWYEGFLDRLKLIDENLWRKEMNKQTKTVNKLNPTFRFEENNDE